MYANNGGLPFGAGHASAAIAAPALEWFLAEGATGDFFDLFVLIANPNAETANLAVTYLLPNGTTVARTYQVGPKRRYTIYVDEESRRLANTAVSTIVRSTNGVPVIVERAMWWPGPRLRRQLVARGAQLAGLDGRQPRAGRWRRASRTGPTTPRPTSSSPTRARRPPRPGSRSTTRTAAPRRRRWPSAARAAATVRVTSAFPDAAGRRFGAIVESIAGSTALVVERAMYTSVGGDIWAGGTNALGTPIDLVPPGPGWSAVSVTASDPQALEQGLDGGVFTFTRGTTGSAQTVAFTISGTATPGVDYRAPIGTVTIPAGATSTTLAIAPVDDTLAEPTETITLSLVPGPQYRDHRAGVGDHLAAGQRHRRRARQRHRRQPFPHAGDVRSDAGVACSRCGRSATTPGSPRRRRRRPARSSASSIRSTPTTCPRTTCRKRGSPTPPTPPISCGCGSPTR